ncbi:unnamed protein product [Arabidopsis halleri]
MEDDGMSDGPKLPIPGKRNILITSALPYVNSVPQLGNIIGCVLSADVYARYCRLRGYNAIYICGTNDYGTATETKATETKALVEICDKYHAIHKEVYDWFDISFDKFGRTSTPQHTQVSQAIFNNLWENQWLIEDTIQQLYCDTCKDFLADRLVEGSCPFQRCNYGSARGDQELLNPTELKVPMCKICRTTPRICDPDHRFIELPLLDDKLVKYIMGTSVTESWSKNAIQPTMTWLKEGLINGCVTRDLTWGLPGRHVKYKDKVFYVWFDAPIGYVSITSCYTSEWEKWWKNPENVELYQFMGKDDVPFHTVMFPSAQLGSGENWTVVKTISATEYLKYEGGKFSQSECFGVFGNDVKDTNIPVEVWRYYLLTIRPEVSDASFEWKDLQAKLNNKLLSLGNFVSRVLGFIAKPEPTGYGSVIPDAPGAESHLRTKILGQKVGGLVAEYVKAMEKVKLKHGLATAMLISGQGIRYWRIYKEDKTSCAVVVRTAAGFSTPSCTIVRAFHAIIFS